MYWWGLQANVVNAQGPVKHKIQFNLAIFKKVQHLFPHWRKTKHTETPHKAAALDDGNGLFYYYQNPKQPPQMVRTQRAKLSTSKQELPFNFQSVSLCIAGLLQDRCFTSSESQGASSSGHKLLCLVKTKNSVLSITYLWRHSDLHHIIRPFDTAESQLYQQCREMQIQLLRSGTQGHEEKLDGGYFLY